MIRTALFSSVLLIAASTSDARPFSQIDKSSNTVFKNGFNTATYADFSVKHTQIPVLGKDLDLDTANVALGMQMARFEYLSMLLGAHTSGFSVLAKSGAEDLSYVNFGFFGEALILPNFAAQLAIRYGTTQADYSFTKDDSEYKVRTRGTFIESALLIPVYSGFKLSLDRLGLIRAVSARLTGYDLTS